VHFYANELPQKQQIIFGKHCLCNCFTISCKVNLIKEGKSMAGFFLYHYSSALVERHQNPEKKEKREKLYEEWLEIYNKHFNDTCPI